MTKQRPPVTIENTLYRVLGELGIDRAGEATGRGVGYLRALTDPENRQQLTVCDMIALDLACREAGDHSFPLFETIGLILQTEASSRFADSAELGRLAGEASREGGEATAALITAAMAPANDPLTLRTTLQQLEEAHEVYSTAISAVRCIIDGKQPVQPP